MLVLTRKKSEEIVIPLADLLKAVLEKRSTNVLAEQNIKIIVTEIRGDKVRIGIEADKSIPVHRREVYEAIKRGDSASPAPVPPKNDAAAAA